MEKRIITIILIIITSTKLFAMNGFELTFDNDLGYSDQYYTNGLKLEYFHSNDLEYKKSDDGYELSKTDTGLRYKFVYGLKLGQEMYTPKDIRIDASDISEYERPYAGWLYAEFYRERFGSDNSYLKYGLTVGLTGDHAQAELAQKIVHIIVDAPEPQGWSTQIEEEVGLQFEFTYIPKNYNLVYRPIRDYTIQFSPIFTLDLGNIFVNGAVGGRLRMGTIYSQFQEKNIEFDNLDLKELGLLKPRSTSTEKIFGISLPSEYYMYIEFFAKGVVHNTLITGSFFDKKSILTKDTNDLVLLLNFGLDLKWRDFVFKYKVCIESTEVVDEKWNVLNHKYNKFEFVYYW